MTSQLEEFELLLIEWEVGTLDDAGIERVREILRTNIEAQTFYLQHQQLNVALQLECHAGLSPVSLDANIGANSAAPPPGHPFHRQRSAAPPESGKRFWIPVAAAVAMIVALAGRVLFLEFSGGQAIQTRTSKLRDNTTEATSTGIAIVTRLVDIEWDSKQASLEVGDALAPGRMAIESGYAQVEFFCGATVVLEGPAELNLKSPMLAQVISGRLRAQVPPAARGFSLEVDGMTVVDLGTEFGLSVNSQGADVQVFDGEVELQQADQKAQRLLAGQGVTRSATGTFDSLPTNSTDFLNIAALETRAIGQRMARYARWKNWSDSLRQDARLLAYYAFDEPGAWDRKLSSSTLPFNSELAGAIVGAKQVMGRWNQKQALEFKRPGDRVRIQIPGEHHSLTFSCWVKIDSLDRWYNSLFLTDNYDQGEPHWQILDSGQLFFSVRVRDAQNRGPEHREVLSPPFWNPSLSGKWLHLATTFDVDAKRVIHYLNGQLLHTEVIPDEQLMTTTRIGRATIGNWSSPQRPDADFAIRNLNGSMDEFALFSAALSADEIKDIYEHGKP